MEKLSLRNKDIVIVGASSGLGKSLAERLSKEDANLYLLSRTIESSDLPFEAKKINCDVTDKQSVVRAFGQIDDMTDKIDVFVNCTGVGLTKSLEDTTQEEIENVINTNLTGVIFTSQEAYKRMLKNKSGHIINVSSTSGLRARDYEPIYSASKWGLRGFTESLRLAAAPHKIRVTGIYPGGMQTNFWAGNEPSSMNSFMQPADVAEQIINVIKSPSSISPAEVVIERGV
jgi:short-subunit dehydrogenase